MDLTPFVPRLLQTRGAGAPRDWTVDGTLVMADVTGFTRLSDALARQGRLGAEELTATLNRLMTLLMAASDDGGDILKFGGDALLLLYSGADHASRACHAARAMQRILRASGRVHLTGAKAVLRMSIGVHSGPVRLALVGSAQTELLVLGPTVARTLELEAQAAPGEVLVSPETAERAARVVRVEPDANGALRLVGTRPLAPAGALFARAENDVDLSAHLPARVRDRPDLLVGYGEHRRVAVGFVVLNSPEVDDPVPALERAVADLEQACAEHQVTQIGTDVWPGGTKVMVATGVPDAVEDPEGQLLRALVRACAHEGVVDVKAGVAGGPVFAGSLGAVFRRSFTLMGDTVNLAARLAGAASWGEMLAAGTLLDEARSDVVGGEPRNLQLKGKPEPVRAVPVVEVRTVRGGGEGAGIPLVDRERELALLGSHLDRSRRGDGTVVEVVGEAGIGKSRLLVEAFHDVPHLVVQPSPYDARHPLWTLRSLLRQLLDIAFDADPVSAGERLRVAVERDAPRLRAWLPLLAVAVGAEVAPTREVDDLDEQYLRPRMFETVGRLLRRIAPRPFVAVIEDAQWVDESSAEALSTILRDVGNRPWLFVLSRRDAPGGLHAGGPAAERLELPPLPAAEAEQLVRIAGGSARSRAVRDEMVRRAGGNPLFLIELARSTGERPDELPASMDAIVASRIDRLDASARALLRTAAVLGPRFDARLLEEVAERAGVPGEDLSNRLGAFVERSGDELAFRREAYREVAYGQLAFRRRREVHRAAAQVLEHREPPAPPGVLARHYFAAHDWERASELCRDAARAASEDFAHEEAVQFLQWAVESGRRAGLDPSAVGSMYEHLGDAAEAAARYDVAEHAYGAARRLLAGPTDRARLLERTGQLRERAGRYPAALSLYSTARRLLAPAADAGDVDAAALGARIDISAAGVRYRQGRWRECMGLCERAAATAAAVGERRTQAHAEYLYDTAAIEVGGPGADRFGEEPLEIFTEIGDVLGQANVLNNLGVRAYYLGRWDEAVNLYTRAQDASERAGDVVAAATAANNVGEILSDQGHFEQAEARFRFALETWTAAEYPIGVAVATSNLGRLARRRHDLGRAQRLLEEAAGRFADIGVDAFQVETEARLIELAVDREDLGDVVARCDELLRRPVLAGARTPLHALLHRLAGIAHLRRGERLLARQRLTESLELARAIDAGYEVALGAVALAPVAGPEAGVLAEEGERLLAGLSVVRTDVSERRATG